MGPPRVMTVDELSDYLKVARSTLYKLTHVGRVPGQKVGKHWRFLRGVFDRWLASKNEPHEPEPGAD